MNDSAPKETLSKYDRAEFMASLRKYADRQRYQIKELLKRAGTRPQTWRKPT